VTARRWQRIAIARLVRLRVRTRPLDSAARLLSWAVVAGVVLGVCAPWFSDVTTFGLLDWDFELAQRTLVKTSLLRFGEAPFWNPYACGGFPAWGYIEGATNLVSPWLLHYLVLPDALALRVEVVGMGLLGAVGAYVLAGLFTRSPSARALVVAIWAVNGRWALQIAAGHTWHLAYALLPWCFFFFERARQPRTRPGDLVGLAVALAMLVYDGGVYPLPHTVLALALYAALLAVLERSARPLAVLGAGGALSIWLAAPKLLPMLSTFRRAPRFVESTESVGLRDLFVMLTDRVQGLTAHPVKLTYGWHENGMYVSALGVGVLLLGAALVRAWREAALEVVGGLLLVLGLGAFARAAPWTLLHAHVPFFSSQHVPTRFLYPAVLLLAVVAAAGIGRVVERRPRLEALVAVVALGLAIDVVLVARVPMGQTMKLKLPETLERQAEMHFEPQGTIPYARSLALGSAYLDMLANRGILECYGLPDFGVVGARAVGDPRYRGEAYVDGPEAGEGGATARIAAWSPNHAEIELSGAAAGSVVVYNMNFDEGWRSDAGPVIAVDDKVAVRLERAARTVTFRYRPPHLALGLFLAALATAACAGLIRRGRASRR
jgi:hypothetical protein